MRRFWAMLGRQDQHEAHGHFCGNRGQRFKDHGEGAKMGLHRIALYD